MSAKYMYACMRRQGPSKTLLGKDGGPATNIDDSWFVCFFCFHFREDFRITPYIMHHCHIRLIYNLVTLFQHALKRV